MSNDSGPLYGLSNEVVVTGDGPIRVVTFNRPDDLNGANRQMHLAMARVWDLIGALGW